MKKQITLILLAMVGVITLGSIPHFASVFASESTDTADTDGKISSERGHLAISPGRFLFGVLEPGGLYTKTFTAYNIGEEALSFNLTVEPFRVTDETYEAIYSGATNRTKITDWVTFPDGKEFSLEASGEDGDRVEITIGVDVPYDAVGGGQYAAVMANIKSSSSSRAVSRIALPLYSTINGEVNYKGKNIRQRISSFSFAPIIKTSSTIENLGNADFEAAYHLLIEPFLGGDPAYDKTEKKIILPETKRIFDQDWKEAPALGIFNVTQTITYFNEDGKEAIDTLKSISIICPLWLIILVIIIIAVLIGSLVYRRKRRKLGHKKSSEED